MLKINNIFYKILLAVLISSFAGANNGDTFNIGKIYVQTFYGIDAPEIQKIKRNNIKYLCDFKEPNFYNH